MNENIKMMKKILIIFTVLWLLASCGDSVELVSLSGKTMGTTYSVKYVNKGKVKLSPEEVNQQVENILKDVNDKMSTYIQESELSRFNQNKEINIPIEISADLATVIKEAIRLNQVTLGKLDVTVGPIVNLWGFGPEKRVEKQPSEQEINGRRAWVGIEKLQLNENAGKFYLTKTVPQLYVDLSAIAKGFGVDKVAHYIESLNQTDYLVEIGGEIRAKGKNIEGNSWQIAIEKPVSDGSRAVEQIIGLDNISMATSGDYRNYFEANGQRFSHEIDPATGMPIQHNLASITVLAPSSMTADGLSTGLFVLGKEKALQVAEEQQIPVYLISKVGNEFEVNMSSAFKKFLSAKDSK